MTAETLVAKAEAGDRRAQAKIANASAKAPAKRTPVEQEAIRLLCKLRSH